MWFEYGKISVGVDSKPERFSISTDDDNVKTVRSVIFRNKILWVILVMREIRAAFVDYRSEIERSWIKLGVETPNGDKNFF